ncbi:hypothetical protein GCM10027155_19260 [Acinetobacter apis]|uniref:Uncharacterized protein n=1 Tax=Acinetobacter apis TaxID=1229165 RepID=A0A217EIF2_9GAMM|nr:hypothetical protein [Acinetobacter apis]SNQ30253.1 hypothetical protein SAMN05444584_2242 [Acinetobacter apis]
MEQIFNLDGILGKNLNDIHCNYYILKKDKETYTSNINFFKEEIFQSNSLYLNLFIQRVFKGEMDIFHYLQSKFFLDVNQNKYYINAGLGAESIMSVSQFSNFIDNEINDDSKASRQDIIKFMYFREIQALLADFEKLVIQVEELTYVFYEKLNSPQIFQSNEIKEGLTTVYSIESRFINSILENIIIKATSILDYLSKFVFEVENIPKSFDIYPKRKSFDYDHGKTKFDQKNDNLKINWTKEARLNTIFDENNEKIFILKRLRNQLIHDGFLDVDNCIYENRVDGILKERFILMPDFDGKDLTKYKSRKLFYSQDRKINLELPILIEELLSSTYQTLNVLFKKYWFGDMSDSFSLTLNIDK